MGVKKIMQPISSLASLRSGESPHLDDAAGSSFEQIQACLLEVGQVVRGHSAATRLLMSAVLARSHALIEDVPGVGKTTLARALAKALGCGFSRIQFTADLLPSDVIGGQVLNPQTGDLSFRSGAIFSNIVLADELNRASPKTQSALLEAMSDRQVTVDEKTYALEAPFSVLATQNPVEHHGAYPLPESQLDRFLICIHLGYPGISEEKELIQNHREPNQAIESMTARMTSASVVAAQEQVAKISMSDPVTDYLLELVSATRDHEEVTLGCSPRGALGWSQLARAYAFLSSRDYVIPDDIQFLAPFVLSHRLSLRGTGQGRQTRSRAKAIIDEIVAQVPVPR